ncbi:MAG: 50S ribosomal protein L11 methyltransferase [Pseudomonadota bacterium]
MAPPLVPEIVLHLAEESVPLWQKTEEALAALNVPPPFWAFAWAGGQALARYVLDHADLVRSKRVLDLGAGGGLAALAAAKAGACRVIAADVDPFCAPACRLNAAANDVTLATHSGDLLAGDVVPPDADVVLVADLFYERAMAQAVLHFIDQAHRRGARVLIGDPSRSYFPADRFTQLATYNVAVTRELEDMDIKRTSVWSP